MTSLIKSQRRIRSLMLCFVVAATLSLGTIPGIAQQSAQPSSPVNIKPEANEAPETHSWTIEQLLPLTVSEAWQMSGKSEDKFFDMVQDLAAFAAQKRNLVLPASEAAGQQAGEYIKQQAKLDRDQLLYAVVDQAVRKVGTPALAQASESAK
jgi:hypothetical protein